MHDNLTPPTEQPKRSLSKKLILGALFAATALFGLGIVGFCHGKVLPRAGMSNSQAPINNTFEFSDSKTSQVESYKTSGHDMPQRPDNSNNHDGKAMTKVTSMTKFKKVTIASVVVVLLMVVAAITFAVLYKQRLDGQAALEMEQERQRLEEELKRIEADQLASQREGHQPINQNTGSEEESLLMSPVTWLPIVLGVILISTIAYSVYQANRKVKI